MNGIYVVCIVTCNLCRKKRIIGVFDFLMKIRLSFKFLSLFFVFEVLYYFSLRRKFLNDIVFVFGFMNFFIIYYKLRY